MQPQLEQAWSYTITFDLDILFVLCVYNILAGTKIRVVRQDCLPFPHILKLPFSLTRNLPILRHILHRPIQPHPLLLRLHPHVSLVLIIPSPSTFLDTYLTLRHGRHKPINLPQIPTCLDHAILPIPALLSDMRLESVVNFCQESVADDIVWPGRHQYRPTTSALLVTYSFLAMF
jgi:hypothetical protein